MSTSVTNLALFSLLSAQALARPEVAHPWKRAHAHGGAHHHHAHGTGYYPGNQTANSTGLFPYTGNTATSTLIATVSPVAANSEVVSDSSCATEGETVTQTATNVITVTVTPGGSSAVSVAATESSAATSSEESSASAAQSTVASVSSLPHASMYHGPQPQTTEASTESTSSAVSVESSAPVSSSFTAEAATSSIEVSSYVAPITSSVAAAASSYVASSSASSSTAAESSSAPGTKRGVAYNESSMTGPFEGSAPWAWNWVPTAGDLDTSKYEYIPTCKDASSYWTGLFVSAMKDSTPKTIFSFNEPDNAGQANMDVAACVSAFDQYIGPHNTSGAEIVAPAVTNSQTPGEGLDYLDSFLSSYSGTKIDAINLHWYDSYKNTQGFIDYVNNASATLGKKFSHLSGSQNGQFTTYITEFGFTDGEQHDDYQYHPASDADQATALKAVLPFLDAQSFVKRYSYFMVYDGLLVNDGSTTQSGDVYKSFSAPYNG
ncbi:glycoside hydrolase family 128 protein [Viridothelium virens]|uniref:Glycoside hydrolase family 128 protein n=1 Tax=Viridothelium virens TaxID=1048519 RepID=A0A6A6GXQ3_VIRVR|nr:glycoside hydrolase family 128 protein [Viridothelium virens]